MSLAFFFSKGYNRIVKLIHLSQKGANQRYMYEELKTFSNREL